MESQWVEAADFDAVPQDDVTPAIVQGREIALYGIDGEVFATDMICTHGHARLCDGFVFGEEIECPLHQGRFNIRSGQATCEPAVEAIRTYPVKIENGKVFVAL